MLFLSILAGIIIAFGVQTAQSADLYSAEFASRLMNELIGLKKALESPLTTLVYQEYERNQQDPHLNYLLGIVHYSKNEYETASSRFRKAAELSGFSEELYLKNYVSIGAMHNYTSVAEYLMGLLVYQPMQEMVIELLLQLFLPKYQTRPLPDELLLHTPNILELWAIYAMPRLHRHSEQRIDEADKTILTDPAYERNMTIYGLSLFPRHAHLQLLRAYQSYEDGDQYCARYFIQLSGESLKPASLIEAYQRFDEWRAHLLALLSHTNDKSNEATVPVDQWRRTAGQCRCSPCLSQLTSDSYQSLYDTINSVAGPNWSVLRNTTDATKTAVNDIVPNSIHHTAPQPTAQDSAQQARTTGRVFPSLQVGCSTPNTCALPGFFVADAMAAPSTHFVTQATDLSMVATGSVGLVYSSHTLEHLSHTLPPEACLLGLDHAQSRETNDSPTTPHLHSRSKSDNSSNERQEGLCSLSEVDAALSEWRRVLIPEGLLLVAVPDTDLLLRYFLEPETTLYQKQVLIKYIYGGQQGVYDFHKVGFNFELLATLLQKHGFCEVRRVSHFRLFKDASSMNFLPGKPVSLNVIARAC